MLRPRDRPKASDLRVNLLGNYGWRWNLLASGVVSGIDLVCRWGGRRRLSGFLPVQCA